MFNLVPPIILYGSVFWIKAISENVAQSLTRFLRKILIILCCISNILLQKESGQLSLKRRGWLCTFKLRLKCVFAEDGLLYFLNWGSHKSTWLKALDKKLIIAGMSIFLRWANPKHWIKKLS